MTAKKSQLEASVIGVVTLVMGALLLAFPAPATATSLDLTGTTESGFINDALYTRNDTQATGTGVIDSFVRLNDNNSIVSAYNTTVSNVLDNTSDATHNHALLLELIPLLLLQDASGEDVWYREFLLDINENGRSPFISLDEVQIFQSGSPNQSITTFDANGVLELADSTLIYRMDPDSTVLLDYRLNHGSGSGDMFLYVPDSFFSENLDYVYLYSLFGVEVYEDAGFEEWSVRTFEPIPEPSTLALLSLGLGIFVRRQRRT